MALPTARLAILLAELFPNRDSAVRIMAAVGIQADRIYLDQPSGSRWYYIVDEAAKSGLLAALIDKAVEIYPGNVDLRKLQTEMKRAQQEKKRQLTVLAVWPSLPGAVPLDQAGEAEAMYAAGIDYVPLEGANATRDNLAREWDRMEPRVVAFGAHGLDGEVYLADGPIDVGWIGRLAADHQPELILLMACESSSASKMDISDALIDEGVNAVIAVSKEIEDSQVILFVRSFYRYYGRGDALRRAFDRAKLGLTRESAQMIRLRETKEV